MKGTTRQRKKTIRGIDEGCGRQWIVDQMYQVFAKGKQGFDICMKEMGRLMAETIMYIEREEISGPDYQPTTSEVRKWASQGRLCLYRGSKDTCATSEVTGA